MTCTCTCTTQEPHVCLPEPPLQYSVERVQQQKHWEVCAEDDKHEPSEPYNETSPGTCQTHGHYKEEIKHMYMYMYT